MDSIAPPTPPGAVRRIALATMLTLVGVALCDAGAAGCPAKDQPFALVVEVQGMHVHVLPSSIAFARSLGAPHVVVWYAGRPLEKLSLRTDLGARELFDWFDEPNVTFVDDPTVTGRIRCIAGRRRPAFVVIQTLTRFSTVQLNMPDERLHALVDLLVSRQGRAVPVFVGQHFLSICAPAMRNLTEQHQLKKVIPFALTKELYEVLKTDPIARFPGVLQPTWFTTSYMGMRVASWASRAPVQCTMQSVTLVTPATVDYNKKNWDALYSLKALDTGTTRVRLHVIGSGPRTSLQRFQVLQRDLALSTAGRVTVHVSPLPWKAAVELILANTSFLLPMIDDLTRKKTYVQGLQSPAAIGLAMATAKPLVIWHALALRAGVPEQFTYQNSTGFLSAVQRAVDVCRHGRTEEYVIRARAMYEHGLDTFATARALTCKHAWNTAERISGKCKVDGGWCKDRQHRRVVC